MNNLDNLIEKLNNGEITEQELNLLDSLWRDESWRVWNNKISAIGTKFEKEANQEWYDHEKLDTNLLQLKLEYYIFRIEQNEEQKENT